MKTLIVYPTYTPSKEAINYHVVSTALHAKGTATNNKLAAQYEPKTVQTTFYSTSAMLAPIGGPRRTGAGDDIDWGGGATEIDPSDPTNNGNYGIAEASPIGDIVLPMMVMMLGYVLYRRLVAKLRSL